MLKYLLLYLSKKCDQYEENYYFNVASSNIYITYHKDLTSKINH